MVAGQKSLFAVFGSRAGSEMQEPFTNAGWRRPADVCAPLSPTRTHRDCREICQLMFGRIRAHQIRGRARLHHRSCRTDAPHSHDDHGRIGNIIEFVAHSMVARSLSWPRRRRRAPCCRRYAVAGRGFVSTSGWKKTGFPVYAHSAGGYHESLNRRQRWRLP